MFRGPSAEPLPDKPMAISMERVRRRDAPKGGDQEEWATYTHAGVGVELSYPKTWEAREDTRRIVVAYPADRGISLNLIVGTAEGNLDELSAQAFET